jgi:hypothetical protein
MDVPPGWQCNGIMKSMRPTALSIQHSLRFRKVSTLYPKLVSLAYRGHGGRRQAAKDSDKQVARRVAAWEREQGKRPRDWVAWGRDTERGEA